MKTVLVTGAAGFIGSNLCERLLDSGFNVIGLDNFCSSYDPVLKRENITEALKSSSYTLIEGDILNSELLNRLFVAYPIDAVVHLAALAGVRRSLERPLDYVDVDIKGTVGLLECSRRHKIKKFVFASSSSVYGNAPSPFSEEMPLPVQASPYAAAKYAGELFCGTYHHLYGIPAVCLRFFTVYGPRQRPDMAIRIFTQAVYEGRDICIFGDGTSSRDYTYVDDVVDGITAALKLDCGFEAINLGSSRPIKIAKLISLIENNLSRPAIINYLPVQAGDVAVTCANIQKAERLLNYAPGVPVEDGVARFTKWYCSYCSKKEQV